LSFEEGRDIIARMNASRALLLVSSLLLVCACKPEIDGGGAGSGGASASSGATGTGGAMTGTGGTGGAGAMGGMGGMGGMAGAGGMGGMGGTAGAGGMAGAGGGGMYAMPMECPGGTDDAFEENDVDTMATAIPLTGYSDPEFYYMYAHPTACHGAGDDDWYLIQTNVGLGANTLLRVRARVAGVGTCANESGVCGEYLLAPSPENTIGVELYDAVTHVALGGSTNDQGFAVVWGEGMSFANDVLVRVVGPENTSWGYTLDVLLRGGLYEDECEC